MDKLARRASTDTDGIAKCLGLQSEAKLDMQVRLTAIEQKITEKARFDFQKPPPIAVTPDRS